MTPVRHAGETWANSGVTESPGHLPQEDAPHGYENVRDQTDGCLKVVLRPST